jgi:hypothetical protein
VRGLQIYQETRVKFGVNGKPDKDVKITLTARKDNSKRIPTKEEQNALCAERKEGPRDRRLKVCSVYQSM